MASVDTSEYFWDDWPLMEDGNPYNGENLLELVSQGKSPFRQDWDVKLLIDEVEQNLNVIVADIPRVDYGSNNYGFHIRTSEGLDLVARLARGDINMPYYDGLSPSQLLMEVKFEKEVYEMLADQPATKVSRLLYSRAPLEIATVPKDKKPTSIVGRRLAVFERAEGKKNVWKELSLSGKELLLERMENIRAALFNFQVPSDFAEEFLHDRITKFKPEAFLDPIVPSRSFCSYLLTSKIEATIRNTGDQIGYEEDQETVGSQALQAKSSILRLIPHILPAEDSILYRFVLEHDDFGIHNVSIDLRSDDLNGDEPKVTSLYDWDTGLILPAILSDPLIAIVPCDLVVDGNGDPALTRTEEDATEEELNTCKAWATYYIKSLYDKAPEYEKAMKAGGDARHIWFAFRDWRGGESEQYYGELGDWAERRLAKLNISKVR